MDRPDILRSQDLKPGREVVLVEYLGRSARALVRDAVVSGRLVIYKQAIHGVRKTDWFQTAVEGGGLREFSFYPFKTFYEFWLADDMAFTVVEAVYAALNHQGLVPVATLVELYDDESVEPAFKKRLLRGLADFYQICIAIRLLASEGIPVMLYPSAAWLEAGAWLDFAKVHWALPEGTRVECGLLGRLIRAESGLEWLRWAGILALLPAWVLLGVRRIRWSMAPPFSVQVGIRVYTTDWGFPGENSREIDWLLDHQQLRRENTLFVIEKPVSAKYGEELDGRRYRWVDVSRQKAFWCVSRRFLFGKLLGRGLKAWVRLLTAAARTPGLFLEVAARGWLEYLRWMSFLERWRPRHYVAYNHFHFDHVFRNSLLRQAGCESWYYVHSVNDRPAFFFVPGRAIRVEQVWAYLGYDNEVHWGRRDEELYRRMRSSTHGYHVWGPLLSSSVRHTPLVAALIERRRSALKVETVVAVFDTSFGSVTAYDEADAREFYDALAAMLERPDWASRLLLFKSKNCPDEFRAQVSSETASSLDRLLAHPRCVSLRADVAPGAAIAEADLTVSIAYTSTTIEALGARRRAFYFDPGGKFRESYYERFPNLVAHDREALARLCEHWLQMPDSDFQKYLDHHIAPEFGGYLDSGAVARFREALSIA